MQKLLPKRAGKRNKKTGPATAGPELSIIKDERFLLKLLF
ncbi:hypothetical protein ABIE26_002901 [Pedobacter africanus]|uniref:Uncharacterized protein n=1 Tax=Pedobacter africanus TaxID=151894 RepID=A0ACC6KWU2_9SPHI|nr:hypothetical protein [Pedobacter africanus]